MRSKLTFAEKAVLALPHPCWDGEEAQKVRGGTSRLQGHMVSMDQTVSGVRTPGGSPSAPASECSAWEITCTPANECNARGIP